MFSLFRKRIKKIPVDRIMVGLGNPGSKYRNTRHNIGFKALEEFAKNHHFSAFKKECKSLVSLGSFENRKVLLVLPQTYMNASGEVLGLLSKNYVFDLLDLLVVHDDLDLPLGGLRYRSKGSSGGHNGLKSLEFCLDTQEFQRLKFGIGKQQPVIDFVLGNWSPEETDVIERSIPLAISGMELWLRGEKEKLNGFFKEQLLGEKN